MVGECSPKRSTAKDAVLFDAVGTLFNMHPLLSGLLREELSRHGYDIPAAEIRAAAYRAVELAGWPSDQPGERERRNAWTKFIAVALAELPGGLRAPEVVASATNRVLSPASYRCYPDVIPHLSALRRTGARLALVSNFDDFLFPVLRHLGLHAAFDIVCTSYRIGTSKPAPEMFLYSLERLALTAAQVIMVGDSLTDDVAGAAALGIPAVLIDRYEMHPRYRDGPRVISLTGLPCAVPGYPLPCEAAGQRAQER